MSAPDQARLLRAYAELPNGIPDGARLNERSFVLGRDGRLHNHNHAFIDDYPLLARRFGEKVPIAQDSGQAALRFYDSCGVKRLSEAAILSQTKIGNPQDEPHRIGATKTRRQLDSNKFRSGLSALINREIAERPGIAMKRLQASELPRIQSLVFVDVISHEYQLGSDRVIIDARHLWKDTTLYIVLPQSRSAFRDTVSIALAEAIFGSSRSARMFASAIYRLLECNSTEEIADFLDYRGIPWQMDSLFEAWELERDADRIGDSMAASLVSRERRAAAEQSRSSDSARTPDPAPASRYLPPIEEVVAQEVSPVGIHISSGAGETGGSGGGWSMVAARSGVGSHSR